MKTFGTISRGIKTPIIKSGDNLADIAVNSLIAATSIFFYLVSIITSYFSTQYNRPSLAISTKIGDSRPHYLFFTPQIYTIFTQTTTFFTYFYKVSVSNQWEKEQKWKEKGERRKFSKIN